MLFKAPRHHINPVARDKIEPKDVPADVVYTLLSKIYTPEGLAHMVNLKSTAKGMSIEDGIKGIVTPLHPGAEKFWQEKGVLK